MPPISSFGSAPFITFSSPAAATASTQLRRSLLATSLLLRLMSSFRLSDGSLELCHVRGARAPSSCESGVRAALRRNPHGAEDFRVGRAAAQVAGEKVPDFVVARIGVGIEQLPYHQDEAGGAEPALERPGLDEGLLHRVETVRGLEPFDRLDRAAVEEPRQR